ncbi:MAG TPA: CoA pyrophosphatase [Sphingobium sp.]|nr:CoA pyrophosphatase [Sphingobium sp.]
MRLRDQLARILAEGHKRDHPDIDPGMLPLIEDHDHAPSAVLVAITDRPEPGLILTQRSDRLRNHAGQVAFPGGRVDPDDADVVAAALREAQEEIALAPRLVDVIGTSDPYFTHSGYAIVPVIGVIPPDIPLVPHPDEVDAIFEVPLVYALDPARRTRQSSEWEGEVRHYHEIVWEDRRIWGVTAAMLVNLSYRLDPAALRAIGGGER